VAEFAFIRGMTPWHNLDKHYVAKYGYADYMANYLADRQLC